MKPNQLSQTAAFLAIKLYGLTRDDEYCAIFDERVISFYENIIQELSFPLHYYHYWLQFRWIRKLYIWSEELLLPGDLLHVAGRKWMIHQQVNKLVDKGYSQIIVLGSGFDHLSYFFVQKNISCFELDTPYMANLKRDFYSGHLLNTAKPKVLNFYLPKDRLKSVLSKQNIDAEKDTIIVAEGFFDYQSADTVQQILQESRTYFKNKPALISTHFALDELSTFHRNVFKRSVQMVGEHLQFEASMVEFSEMLEEHGFTIEEKYSSNDIRKHIKSRVQTNLPILPGFYIINCH